MISLQPALVAGKRSYVIVFSSNAISLPDFDGRASQTALAADGNQEIWTYQLPPVEDVDLTTGADIGPIDLAGGTLSFKQVTTTPASRVPSAGSITAAPFIADDNREATISDDGSTIAFVSTRNLTGNGNPDFNPEIFFYNRSSTAFAQLTNTQDTSSGPHLFGVFNQNPSLSSDGSVVAFLSNGNLTGDNNDDGAGHGNAEVFLANYNGSTFSGLRQVTKTKDDASQTRPVNLFGLGRRLSRDGSVLGLESRATEPKSNGANEGFPAVFIYDVVGNAFQKIGTRVTFDDVPRYPTFTDYSVSLKPSTLVFASAVNFLPDGTLPTTASDGLNPNNVSDIFATQVQIPIPTTPANTFTRLTNPPVGGAFGAVRPLTSNSRKRVAFSEGGVELGGGNADGSIEVFYLLSPVVLSNSPAGMQFFAGASRFGPVPSPSPSPSGSPTPSPSPSPSPSPTPSVTPSPSPNMALGLAPGELTIVTSTVDLALVNTYSGGGDEVTRAPALPVELNGVSVSVNGAAAGLYFVGTSPKQINFVIPIGLIPATNSVTVVINNNGTVLRQEIQIITAQPDVFTTTNDAFGRANVCNITNSLAFSCLTEPFSVKSLDKDGNLVPTVLELNATGVRDIPDPVSLTITVGTTVITATSIRPNRNMPGWDQIDFTLPDTLAGAGDVPIVLSFLGQVGSRSSETAPHITISP
jgi:uncharacterized protein (TIGR03437 family)